MKPLNSFRGPGESEPPGLLVLLVTKVHKEVILINGIIIVNKEQDFTSHDVVAVMRKILGTKKVGHTGTLDPQATGVLPICVGKGTKVSDMLMCSDKEYIARVRLGITTDTQDIWGEVLTESDCSHITEDMVIDAAKKFVGEISQTPPMYSAVKIGGKKLYEYARSGIEVERKSRTVTIHSIGISDFENGEFSMRVSCSKGTYIRTLCADIGESLGVGATMTALVRTKSAMFDLSNAKTLDEIRAIAEGGDIKNLIIPTDAVFANLPEIHLDQKRTAQILNGMFLETDLADGQYRVYGSQGDFLCVGKVENNILKIVKNFYAGN